MKGLINEDLGYLDNDVCGYSHDKLWFTCIHVRPRTMGYYPTVLEEIKPYLDNWPTSTAASTDHQRREIGSKLGIGIDVGDNPKTSGDTPVHSVKIALAALGDWERGYLYIHEDVALVEILKWEFRQVEAHFYLYNHTE